MLCKFFRPDLCHWLAAALLLLVTGTPSAAADSAGDASKLVVPFKAGQLMSVIVISPKAGDDAAVARNTYLQEAFGIAADYGLKPLGVLNVADVIVGEFRPKAVAIYSWTSADSEAAFDRNPDWQPIKETRPDGWDELRIHDRVAMGDQTLTFSTQKLYTLATAWVDQAHPNDYETYLANIEPAVNAVGGRFFYEMVDPEFSSLGPTPLAPSRLTIVEWDGPAALAAFLDSDGFQENSALLSSGTTAFELLGLTVPPRKAQD
ncbi:MAG: DUF1330 domain-containing protein [Pseudomonadota bacterium]